MPEISQVFDERARCAAPAGEFVLFAEEIMGLPAALAALAAGPAAELFARRLVKEALSGAAHAVTCLKLIGELGKEPSWAARLRRMETPGEPPPVQSVPVTDLEPAGRGLLVILRRRALPWIASAYLQTKGRAASELEILLLEGAPTTRTLAAALDRGLRAVTSAGLEIKGAVMARSIEVLEKHAARVMSRRPAESHVPLAELAQSATGKQAARLLAALLPVLLGSEAPVAGALAAAPPAAAPSAGSAGGPPANTAVAAAAWSDADEALGRALQDMDFLARSFERLESAAQGETAERARRARSAANLVLQWVRQAARCRRVAVLNQVGERVPFDPAVHVLDGEAGIGDLVRIVKPAVVRGSAPEQVVVLRAQAERD